ncbi:MAG: 3'-5' exonuclease [Candidatus Magnetominusculus sp. LBB02]|nr:3'-5' exonuclease [Candidatus Magnetominusculus sp. LBB02]
MVAALLNRFFKRSSAGHRPIESLEFVSLDVELTGLDDRRDSILSIGAVKMAGGRIALSESFYRLINPNVSFSGPVVTIHGITPSDVKSSEGIETALRDVIDFCGDRIIIGHCIDIDMAFLNREAVKLTGRPLKNQSLDTLAVYKWLLSRHCYKGDVPLNPSLYDIAKRFDIPVDISHNAVMDAFIAAQLLQRFISALCQCGVKYAGDLLRVGNAGCIITRGEISNL